MDVSQKILSDVVVFQKYAKYEPEIQRRETWDELCMRNMAMHIRKYPQVKEEIKKVYKEFVFTKKVLPSMRSMQFAGLPIELSPSRMFNCSYTNVDHPVVFAETMMNLLSGSGVGFSVQKRHISKLPIIKGTTEKKRSYLIGDSILGWADAIKHLFKAYTEGKSTPVFDYRDIRPKGAKLITSGGKAPGPDPLRICIDHIQSVLNGAVGRKLTSLEVYDIQNFIADAVLAGGIRRAAMICLFDFDDMDMLYSKSGNWWELNPQRGRSNNSVLLKRGDITKEQFESIWEVVKNSGAGEPGFIWTDDLDSGLNPCCVSGDTNILTNAGYYPIKELVGQTVSVWNGYEYSDVTPFSVGTHPTTRVTLSNGVVLDVTTNHKFVVSKGYTDNVGIKVETHELKIGDKLFKFDMPIIDGSETPDIDAYSQGFYSGDGNDSLPYSTLYFPKYCCQERLIGTFGEARDDLGRKYWKHGNMLDKRFVPMNASTEYKLNWLAGILDSDGTVTRDKNGNGFQIVSIEKSFLDNIQLMITTMGIVSKVVHASDEGRRMMPDGKGGSASYLCKKSSRILIGNMEAFKLGQLGLVTNRLQWHKESPQRSASRFVTVSDIEYLDSQEHFCFTEELRGLGVFNGVVTGQSEIGLRSNQYCNLTETNVSDVHDQEELNKRVRAAAFIGTLQAGYTNFHYLRSIWQDNTEEEALIGVGMTGIASGSIMSLNLTEAANVVKEENARVAGLIGINIAARTTCVKPSGSTSCVVGSSSGIHAWHDQYYIRRVRIGKNESLYQYLKETNPELIEDCVFKPHLDAVLSLPQKAPEGAILRYETPFELLERVKKFNVEWVKPGKRSGTQDHNVSCTISIKDDEWNPVCDWMWNNRDFYTGISVLPFSEHTYKQAPFESCTKEVYEEMMHLCKDIDLSKVVETENHTNLMGESACGAGGCEVK